jgi:hypothetical protein
MGLAFCVSTWKLPGCWVCALAVTASDPSMQATAAEVIASFFIISSFSVVPGFPG